MAADLVSQIFCLSALPDCLAALLALGDLQTDVDLDLAGLDLEGTQVSRKGLELVCYALGFENFARGSFDCSAGCWACVGVRVGEPLSAETVTSSAQFLQ